jgi:hypothetical protein
MRSASTASATSSTARNAGKSGTGFTQTTAEYLNIPEVAEQNIIMLPTVNKKDEKKYIKHGRENKASLFKP